MTDFIPGDRVVYVRDGKYAGTVRKVETIAFPDNPQVYYTTGGYDFANSLTLEKPHTPPTPKPLHENDVLHVAGGVWTVKTVTTYEWVFTTDKQEF